jgi:hypothetical protein
MKDLRPLLIVLGSVVVFGLAVVPLGLVLATILLIVISSTASHEFRWKEAVIASVILAGVRRRRVRLRPQAAAADVARVPRRLARWN